MAAHDGWWIMRVADSLGQSAPGTAASILNPALGLSLLYAQTFESSRAEYLSVAAERGLDTSEEAAERYGHNQALIQTPFEMVGTVAIGRAMKSIFKSIPRKALTSGPETYGKWLSSQIGKAAESTAGEVFITTPAQTVGESLLAESAGVRDQTTWNEKGTATLDAMSIALGQSSFMTGSSIVAAGTVKTVKGDFAAPNPLSQAPRPGQKFDPEKQAAEPILIGEESALRFSKSKNKTPHYLAIPRESTYNSPNERLHDPAFVLQNILRGSSRSAQSERGKHGGQLASGSSLSAWATIHGRNLRPEVFASYDAGGGEHSVLRDEETGRIVKLTKPGLFGAQAEDAGSYLERMALSNRVFGDDVRFEGVVTLPGEDAPRTVTSQSFVKGRDATAQEQRDYLLGKGFIEHEHRWVHPILGVAVWDTQTPGNVITRPDGTMQAVDLQIEPARPEELRAVRESSGLGREPVFSKGNKQSDVTHPGGWNRQQIDGVIEKLREIWAKSLPIKVVYEDRELSHMFKGEDLERIKGAKPEALYDGLHKEVVLFPTNFFPADGESLDSYIERKVAHEIVGHHGLSRLFQGDLASEYESIVESAFLHISRGRFDDRFEKNHGYRNAKELAEHYEFDLSTFAGKAGLVEEHFARLAEEEIAPRWYHEAIHQITSLLRRLGMSAWTHADTLLLIQRSRKLGLQAAGLADEIRLSRDLTRVDSVQEVIDAARQPGNSKKYVRFEVVDLPSAITLPRPQGILLEGFRRMIDTFAIRHIEHRHGIASGDATPVTDQDIKSLPEILKAPGASGLAGMTDTGKEGILHVRYLNGWYFILEEVRFGNRVLAVTSLWKRRPLAKDARTSLPTSETLQGTAEEMLAQAVEDFKAKRKR